MSKVKNLFLELDSLDSLLRKVINKTRFIANVTSEIGGEIEQELGTDISELESAIEILLEDLESIISEGKTLRNDNEELESGLRAGLKDEENYKIEAEHIQEERLQEREERRE